MAASELLIRLGLDDKRFYGALSSAENRIKRFGNQLEGLGKDLTARVSLPIAGIGIAAVNAFAKFEKLEKGLQAITGSAEETQAQLARLRELAQNPGIDLQAAVQGSIRLQSVGFEAAQAEEALLAFSKAVTVSGGNADDLNEVVRQLAQINSSGRITREDFGVIQDRVTGIGLALETAFGTTNIEAIRNSGISAQEFTARLVQGINATEAFQNAQGGLGNAIDNFRQSITQSLVSLGKSIDNNIKLQQVLESVSAFVERVTQGFQNLNPTVQTVIVIAAGLTAAIGPLLLAGGALIKSILAMKVAFTVLTGPIGLVITAVGAAIATFVGFYRSSERFRATINGIGASLKAFALSIFDGLKAVIAPFGKLLEGDIRGAAQGFAQAFEKGNPVALFRNAGQAAGDAYRTAFDQTLTDARAAEQAASLAERVTPDSPTSAFGNFAAVQTPAAAGTGAEQVADQVVQQETALTRLARAQEVAALSGGFLTRQTDLQLESVRRYVQLQPEVENFYASYRNGLEAIVDKQAVFGESVNVLNEQFQFTQQALESAIATYGAYSEEVSVLTSEYNRLNEALATQAQLNEQNAQTYQAAASAFSAASSSQVRSLRDVANAAISASAQVVRAKIQEAVAAWIADSFTKLGVFGAVLAAGAGAVVGGVFSAAVNKISIPALAEGGLVTRPTLALIGEAGPELVTPLNKVGDVMGGGGYGEFVVRGSDLVLVMERASQEGSRIRGF